MNEIVYKELARCAVETLREMGQSDEDLLAIVNDPKRLDMMVQLSYEAFKSAFYSN